jgi:hypothetical protein
MIVSLDALYPALQRSILHTTPNFTLPFCRLTMESLNKTQKLPSALPYIGAYLDLIYTIEMQSKTYNQDGLVNFAKMTKLAEEVTRVLQYQDVGFCFEAKLDVSCDVQ